MKSKLTYLELEKEIAILRKEKADVSNNIQKKILNSINDGTYINSSDYIIEYLNEPMIKMIGDNKIGQKCYKAIYNKDKICEWCILKKLKKDDTISYELNHPLTNNTYIIKNILLENGSKLTSYHNITDRKKAELELENKKAELEAIYDNSPTMMCVLDENQHIVYANKSLQDFVDKPIELLKSMRACGAFGCVFVKENIKGCGYGQSCKDCNLNTALQDTIINGNSHSEIEYVTTFENKGITKNVALLGFTTQVSLTDKKLILLSFDDITDRKKSEQKLIDTKNKLMIANKQLIEQQSIFMVGNVVIFKWKNLDGWPVEYVSENVENVFGYNQEEFISGKVIFGDLIYKNDIEKVSKEITHAIDNNLKYFEHKEYRITNKYNEEVWLYDFTTIIRNDKNEITHFFGYVMNATDRKQSEKELIQNKELMDIALTGYKAGAYVWNMIDNSAYLSSHWKKMVGLKPDQIMPRHLDTWANRVHPDDIQEVMNAVTETITEKKPFVETIHRLKHEYGNWLWILGRGHIEYSSEGSPIKMSGIHADITEQKLREQLIKQQNVELQQANATKDKFFSIISHDLKSPFNAILGFSNILVKNHKKYDAEKREKLIISVNNSAKSAFKLLENLLTWSRSQSGVIQYSPEKLHLKILLFEALFDLQGQADKKNINILDDISENELIFADKNMIATTLRNLISNAIKFTNKDGSIIMSSKNQKDSNFLEISIMDTGVGIDKEKLQKIFDISEKTSTSGTDNETGTGLGLMLCKEFVEKHGGEIWVESEIGKGSTFIFTLPVI